MACYSPSLTVQSGRGLPTFKGGVNAPQAHRCHVIHVVKNIKSTDELINLLLNFNLSSGVTIFLISSPEALMLDCWNDMVQTMIHRDILRLLCIDEVHLFVEFGCTFRPDFSKLRGTIFKKVLSSSMDGILLKTPVLCMTASFTLRHLGLFQKLLGLQIVEKNSF